MAISTNPLKRIATDADKALDIHNAPQAFKWTRSEDLSLDTSTMFQLAQTKQSTIETLERLLNRPIDTAEDVAQLNKDIVTAYHLLSESVTTKKSCRKRTNKKKWFDHSCRNAKREANKADRKADKNPNCQFLREQHFLKKKEYRAIKRMRKGQFLLNMNKKINDCGQINWAALKQLSDQYKDEEPFDIYDLILFHKFFKDLYNRKCGKTSHTNDETGCNPPSTTTSHHNQQLTEELNCDFTIQEIGDAIKKLQNNKSVSDDLISNEMLKNSNNKLQLILQKLFNACLTHGIYPWNTSITTPLHNKGDRQNPDNYRAITVGSCLGKLFSSILLRRLLNFREAACPDLPNQLGFRSGAQCNDHILTLNTVIEKYVKKDKQRL